MSRLFKEHPQKNTVLYGGERVLSATFQEMWKSCKTTLTLESGRTHVNYTIDTSGEKNCDTISDFLAKTMKEIPIGQLSNGNGNGCSIPFK